MSIAIFNQKQFEQALPRHRQTNAPLWQKLGLIDGEFAYRFSIKPGVHIILRSSIKSNGVSADCGEDSIRAWLVGDDMKPLGSKVSKWVTRLPGWEDRTRDMLRKLWGMGLKIEKCPKCGELKKVFKVKKAGPNKGKLFTNCCGNFEWVK